MSLVIARVVTPGDSIQTPHVDEIRNKKQRYPGFGSAGNPAYFRALREGGAGRLLSWGRNGVGFLQQKPVAYRSRLRHVQNGLISFLDYYDKLDEYYQQGARPVNMRLRSTGPPEMTAGPYSQSG